MKLSIGEILEQGSKLEGDEQVAFLRKNFSPALGVIIQHAFEPVYQYNLPEGAPPYKANDLDDQESNLYAEIRRLYVFLKPNENLQKHGGHVPPVKQELLWIQLLENVSKLDAITMIEVSQNRLPYGYTVERMKEIFPGLLSPEAVDGEPAVEPKAEEPEEPKQIEKQEAPKKKAPAKKKAAPKKKAPAKKK